KRPASVFLDSKLNPSFFRTTPAKKPRTECCCQPVAFMMAAMVVPLDARSRANTFSCFVSGLMRRSPVSFASALPGLGSALAGAVLLDARLLLDMSLSLGCDSLPLPLPEPRGGYSALAGQDRVRDGEI